MGGMDDDDFDKLYVISYLIEVSSEESIVGYSDLAARLLFLKKLISGENKLQDYYVEEIRELVTIDEDNSLDWENLKELIEKANSDDHGQMFIEVSSESVGPQKWTYKFSSEAPKEILETRLEEIVGDEDIQRFLEKVDKAAKADDDQLLQHVYNL
jgi:hypothetical protein